MLLSCSTYILLQFDKFWLPFSLQIVQGAPKKIHHSDLYHITVLEIGFYFFHMCFKFIILSPFHQDIQTMPILNINCPKNA